MEQSKLPGAAVKTKGFHKKGSKVIQIPGTKPSIHNSTLLTSTGVPSLDALIGKLSVASVIYISQQLLSWLVISFVNISHDPRINLLVDNFENIMY